MTSELTKERLDELEAAVSRLPYQQPFAYRPKELDDWGCVREATGLPIANTCPPWLGTDFSEEHRDYDAIREAGPEWSRTIAALIVNGPALIAAAREAVTLRAENEAPPAARVAAAVACLTKAEGE